MHSGSSDEDSLRDRAEAIVLSDPNTVHNMPPEEIQRLVHELGVHQIELELQNEELRRAQLELEEARDRYAELYDFAPVGYVTLDDKGVIREANLMAGTILDSQRAGLVGKRLTDFILPSDQDAYHQHRRHTVASAIPSHSEIRLAAHADGSAERFVELQSISLRDAAGTARGCRTALLDITDRKCAEAEREQLEETLLQAQKMEAIGQLAGGVAHDFNNLLMAVLGNVAFASEALAEHVPKHDPVWEQLRAIDRAGRRGAELTQQLLAFGRKQVVKPEIFSPAVQLSGLEKMIRRLIREDVDIRVDCAPDIWSIMAAPAQFEQVLVNLVLNARDALPRGGQIRVSASNAEVGVQDAKGRANASPGSHILLTVSDNGVGMDAATLRRIFEPFFTTRPFGEGSGMGLASVHGIVFQTRGHIVVESEPGRGTSFRIYWPAVREAAATERPATRQSGSLAGTETVVFCEDDDAIRALVERALRAHGYTVLAAADASAALRIAEAHDGPIHVLVTDVIMPGMSGRELAEILSRRDPNLKVVLISGHAADVIGDCGVLRDDVGFMQKPFSPGELMLRVRQTLDGPDSRAIRR